tara:strand:- start:8053 stop:9048 length:996 start_codon:yes stop_codon:yes gene_type:complete
MILFSIYFYKIKKNILYTNDFGFGDYLIYCVEVRSKVNHKTKIFCFSKLQNEIASFFFKKKYIINSFILMPRFMNETHMGYNFLNGKKIFKPTKFTRLVGNGIKAPISQIHNGNKNSIQFIKKRINSSKISNKIIETLRKPTLCLFIKNFSKNFNNHMNFQIRQTRNLNKINHLIFFLSRLKINIIILGKNKDHYIKLLPIIIKKQKLKNIFLLKDLSDNYSISDQAYTALNSIGYIGSASGAMDFFGLLNKKIILIDHVFTNFDKYRKKNFKFLYKKVYDKQKQITKKVHWYKFYNPKKYKFIECTFEDIKKALLRYILKPSLIDKLSRL